MTLQGAFRPETRILAGTHVVQLAAHSVYSLVLLARQHPLRRKLRHEEIQVMELQSKLIGQWSNTKVLQIVYLCL
jgi:hypothetical protein